MSTINDEHTKVASGDDAPNLIAVTTTAQVERTYYVEADNDEQARTRLHSYLKDPEMLRRGVVAEMRDLQVDSTPQRIKHSEPVMHPA